MAFVYQPPGTIPPPPYAASNPIQYSSPRPTMPLPPGAQVPPPNAYIQQQQRIIAAQQQHILASQQRTHPSVPRGTIPQTATANGPQTVGAYPYPQLSYGYAADQAYPIVAQSPHTHLQQQQQQHMLRQPNRTPHMAHVATPVQPLTPSQSSPVVMARPPSSGRGAAAQAYPQPVQRPPALAEGQQAHSNQQVRPPQPQPTQSQSARSAPTPRQASVTPVATHQPYPIASTPAATLSTAQTPVDADRADAAKGSQPGSAVISKAISPHPPSTPRSLRVKTEQIPGTAGNTPPTVDGQNDDRVAGVGASPAAQSELSRSFATTTTALYPTYEVVGASGAGGAYMMLPGGVWSDPGSSVVDPLMQPSAGIHALNHFTLCLGATAGGTQDEWTEFAEEQFSDDARMRLSLLSRSKSDLKLFDIPASSLARVLSTWSSRLRSWSINLHSHSETPLYTPVSSELGLPGNEGVRYGIEVLSEGEWRMIYASDARQSDTAISGSSADGQNDVDMNVDQPAAPTDISEVVWKITILSTWADTASEPNLRLDALEITVDDWESANASGVGEWGLPDRVLRVAEVTQQMQDLAGVMGLAEEGMDAKVALKLLTADEPLSKQGSPFTGAPDDEKEPSKPNGRMEGPHHDSMDTQMEKVNAKADETLEEEERAED